MNSHPCGTVLLAAWLVIVTGLGSSDGCSEHLFMLNERVTPACKLRLNWPQLVAVKLTQAEFTWFQVSKPSWH